MEEEKNIQQPEETPDVPVSESKPVEPPASADTTAELTQLLSRLQELVGQTPQLNNAESPVSTAVQSINKALEFQPMEKDDRGAVEKFLTRPEGPLSRFTNIKE